MAQEKTYLEGFNVGFRMRQYNPELWEKLKPSLNNENDFERGVSEGAEEYEKTKTQTREDEINKIRSNKNQEKEKDQELNR
ncbi:MAG: hypothetical protein JST76_02695 [Bacteroidetes bacterium]|nr:hypothetical protein [Bacteroidota bacterium]